jgi:hypothetical protein
MNHQDREKLVMQLANENRWPEAIHHAKFLPSNWDTHQRFPSMVEGGLSNETVNAILDHFQNKPANQSSGFLFEMAHNLHPHHDTDTVRRLAQAAHRNGGSWLETNAFTSHPNYQLTDDEKNIAAAHDFWKDYEKTVKPSHFAVIKAMHSGKPESITHRGETGKSDEHAHLIPHLKEYARKVQNSILKDENIHKRYYKNEPYIRVHRGVGGNYSKEIRNAAGYNPSTREYDHKNINVPSAPFSSWSTETDLPESFARGRGQDLDAIGHGSVMTKWMPVKDILHAGNAEVLPGKYGVHPGENEIVFAHPSEKIKINTGNIKFEDKDNHYAPFHSGVKREKMAKSLKDKAINLATAAAMMGIPAMQASADPSVTSGQHASKIHNANGLPQANVNYPIEAKALQMNESSGCTNTKHKLITSGINKGTTAVGCFAFTPVLAVDIVKYDKDLKHKYPDFVKYNGVKDQKKIAEKITKDKNFESELFHSHWNHLHKVFSGDENKMAHAWNHGIQGTLDADDAAIRSDDYVKKYNRHKKLLQLEHKVPLKSKFKKSESDEIPQDVRNIRKFTGLGDLSPEQKLAIQNINNLIAVAQIHPVPGIGHFTHSSFVVGTNQENSWLIKVDAGTKPGIMSAKNGLQPVKERAFYELGRDVFGIQDELPYVLLGEVVKKGEVSPAAAIRMLPPKFKLAADLEKERPGSMKAILEKYRKSGTLHKISAVLYILGDGDSHGKNVMTDGYFIKMIDHGSGFADESFSPATDHNIFIPYILRVSGVKEHMSPEDKLKNMPKIDSLEVKNNLKHWILSLDYHSLEAKLNAYKLDSKPSLGRLKKLQEKVSRGISPDQAINELWVLE